MKKTIKLSLPVLSSRFLKLINQIALITGILFFLISPLLTKAENLTNELKVAKAQKSFEVVELVRNTVGMISDSNFGATAFAVGPRQFVTNFHTFIIFLKNNNPHQSLVLRKHTGEELKLKRILKINFLADLVLFETQEQTPYYFSQENLSAQNLSEEDKLFIMGYTGGELKKIDQTANISYEDSLYLTFSVNHFNSIGLSGSPVTNHKGQVVGVVNSGQENMLNVIKLKHLKDLLNHNNSLDCLNTELNHCIREAIKLLGQEAKKGDPVAQYFLASNHLSGLQGEPNPLLAFYGFKQSAEQGYTLSKNALASMYNQGRVVQKDRVLSRYWFQQAALDGLTLAKENLAPLYANGVNGKKNTDLSLYWFQQAALDGLASAQNTLGEFYKLGLFFDQDPVLAKYWFEQSSQQGFDLAQHNLATMHYQGIDGKRDMLLAVYLFEQAALQGLAPSQYNLALMLEHGLGLPKDTSLSALWLARAMTQKFKPAIDYVKSLKTKYQDSKPEYELLFKLLSKLPADENKQEITFTSRPFNKDNTHPYNKPLTRYRQLILPENWFSRENSRYDKIAENYFMTWSGDSPKNSHPENSLMDLSFFNNWETNLENKDLPKPNDTTLKAWLSAINNSLKPEDLSHSGGSFSLNHLDNRLSNPEPLDNSSLNPEALNNLEHLLNRENSTSLKIPATPTLIAPHLEKNLENSTFIVPDTNLEAENEPYFKNSPFSKDLFVKLLKIRSQQGVVSAMTALGAAYQEGQYNLPKDEDKAIDLLTKSMAQGDLLAITLLGFMHINNYDLKKGTELLVLSAIGGQPASQQFLGSALLYGNTLNQDYDLSYFFLNKSTINGDETAKKDLEILKNLMTEPQIKKATELTSEFVKKKMFDYILDIEYTP